MTPLNAITLIAVWLSAPALADVGSATRLMETVRAQSESAPAPRGFHLFNIDTQKRDDKATDPKALPPQRVFSTFLPERSEWRFVVTDARGLVANPLEFLQAGTIVPGKYFGARYALNRYLLNEDGAWVRTFRDEAWRLWSASTPPKLTMAGYRELKRAISRAEFLSTLKAIQQRRRKDPAVRPQLAAGDRLPRLYDPFKTRSIASTPQAPLLPSRVYEVYVPELEGWHYALTDTQGNLAKPLEIVRRGSVLTGQWFGTPDFESRQLSLEEYWIPQRKVARHELLVLSDPPRIKVVTILDADSE